MLHLNFSISNPFSNKFKNLFNKAGPLYGHKFWEVEFYRSQILVEFNFSVNTRCSHAGIDLTFGLLGHTIHLQVYDNRHWNYDEGRYMIYTEDQGTH